MFRVGANTPGLADYAAELIYTDLMQSCRGFGVVSDPFMNTAARPPLDANGFPASDFGITLPRVPYSASAQVLKCRIGGIATITGGDVSNVVTTGDVTTFDFNYSAGRSPDLQHTVTFTNTRRTAASATNTGVSSIVIRAPGYAVDTPDHFLPGIVAYLSRFSTLRMMDMTMTNNNVTTITPTDRSTLTSRGIAAGQSAVSVEKCVNLANLAGTNLWINIPAAANDALIAAIATVIRDNLAPGKYCIFEYSNENWNAVFAQHNWIADQALTEVMGFSYQYAITRKILSASRSAGVITVNTSQPHGYTVGQTIKPRSIGISGATTVTATPSSTSFSFAAAGADGAIGLGGGSSVVGNFTGQLNSYDGEYDQFLLQRRWYARRTAQMGQIIKTVFGASDFGVRAKVGLFNQPAADQRDQLQMLDATMGAPNTLLHGIGNASYIFLDATAFGGPNLRNATSYNGNTPPSIADYASAWALTGAGAQINDRYDQVAIAARLYGLKMWQYEFGPDATASPPNSAGAAVGLRKIDTLFDPLFKPSYKALLNAQETHGFEEVCIYSAGTTPVGTSNEYACWGISRTYDDTTSPRIQAAEESKTDARLGITRNPLAAAGTTTLDGRLVKMVYTPSGAYPGMEGAEYNITAPADGSYNLTLTVDAVDTGRVARLLVNGTLVHTYTFASAGISTTATVSVSLTAGTNVVQFVRNVDYLGTAVRLQSLSFTKA